MQWPAVQKRVHKIWQKIAKDQQGRSRRSEGQIKYEDELVFEAALYMVWHNHSMRNRLAGRFPSPNPLYLRLAAMVRSRVLDRVWAAYLEDTSRAEREEWSAAFERIQRNRRKGMNKGRYAKIPKRGEGSKPERTGLSSGLAWIEILLRGLEDVCEGKGIDLDLTRERT